MYITFKKQYNGHQMDFSEIYKHLLDGTEMTVYNRNDRFFNTFTVESATAPNTDKYPLLNMIQALETLQPELDNFLAQPRETLYTTFYIPKRKGGMRRIDAPCQELKTFLRKAKDIFELKLHCLSHNCAYAYVRGRSTKEALMIHQENESKWFLKLDMKDFFPSCTPSLIKAQLQQVFPFSELYNSLVTAETLDKLIELCTYEGHLPQGTPMSPLLTNLIMIPYDYKLQHKLYNFAQQTFKYTRYADDMLISCKYDFKWKEVETEIQKILQPFQIKAEKTRYGSANGRNWNLGLMLNKDNKITLGHEKKHTLKAVLYSFLHDFTNNTPWSIMDTQVLMGNIAYYRKIEPDYTDYLIRRYSEKFAVNFTNCIKTILN
jgi:hypothetical protein